MDVNNKPGCSSESNLAENMQPYVQEETGCISTSNLDVQKLP